jgi:tetratricopeptide (TPR) repeat protein
MRIERIAARTTALALAASCALTCAGAPLKRSALDGWQVAEVQGVRFVAQASPQELDAFTQDLEGFDAAFSFLTGRRIAPPGPTTIILVRDGRLAGRLGLGGGVAGYALSNFDGSFTCVWRHPSLVETRITLFHEFTHLLLNSNRRASLPRWYNEGIADYFSTVVYRDGALVVGAVPGERLVWLAEHKPMPLAQLFGGDRYDTLYGRKIFDFYATAWGLIHYLMATPTGRSQLSRFEQELARGTPLDEARKLAFGRSFDEMTRELSAHVAYLAHGVAAEVVLDPRKVHVPQPSPAEPLGRAEVASAIGSLALARGEDPEDDTANLARAALETAVAEEPADARARAALARARARAGDANAAEEILARALRDAPDDAKVQLDAGEVALAAQANDWAQVRFRRAIELDSGSAAAWFGLGRALASSAQGEPAREAFEHARSLGWSARLDLELGRLHVAAHRATEARALLHPLAQDPHGGSIADQATELLRKLESSEED